VTIERIPAPAGTARAPRASECTCIDGWAFVNGVGPVDAGNDRAPLPEMVEAQVRKVLANAEAILGAAGLTRDDVLSVRVHLAEYDRLHERFELGYEGFFVGDRLPTRSVVGVSRLPRGALVNMDFVARKA